MDSVMHNTTLTTSVLLKAYFSSSLHLLYNIYSLSLLNKNLLYCLPRYILYTLLELFIIYIVHEPYKQRHDGFRI